MTPITKGPERPPIEATALADPDNVYNPKSTSIPPTPLPKTFVQKTLPLTALSQRSQAATAGLAKLGNPKPKRLYKKPTKWIMEAPPGQDVLDNYIHIENARARVIPQRKVRKRVKNDFRQCRLPSSWIRTRTFHNKAFSPLTRIHGLNSMHVEAASSATDDELLMEQSMIHNARQTITWTNMRALYRLKGSFLKAVPLSRTRPWKVYLKGGKTKTVMMRLYLERDAEFEAWRMYGGFEGFLSHIYDLYRRRKFKTIRIPVSYHAPFKLFVSKQIRTSTPNVSTGNSEDAAGRALIDEHDTASTSSNDSAASC